MTWFKKGFAHLTLLFILAILLLITTLVTGQRTSTSSQAALLPQDYYGIVQANDFFECQSGYSLVNLEGDAVADCLVVPADFVTGSQSLEEFVDQYVKVYGNIQEITGQRHLFIRSIEKTSTSLLPKLKDTFLDVLGTLIKKFTNLRE